MNPEQQLALNAVDEAGFVLQELWLYLDTHPADRDCLLRCQQAKQTYLDALSAYERRFGPLTPLQAGGTDRWSWAASPWPWETED